MLAAELSQVSDVMGGEEALESFDRLPGLLMTDLGLLGLTKAAAQRTAANESSRISLLLG